MMNRVTRRQGWVVVVAVSMLFAAIAMFSFNQPARADGLGRIAITTEPPGAKIYVRGQIVGTTPATLTLPAGKSVPVRLVKSGYQPKTIVLKPAEGSVQNLSYTLNR